MSKLQFTGWMPIGTSPKDWEGKVVFWRDIPVDPFQMRTIPQGFSRLAHHCGEIQVAGIEGGSDPLAELPDFELQCRESEKARVRKRLNELFKDSYAAALAKQLNV